MRPIHGALRDEPPAEGARDQMTATAAAGNGTHHGAHSRATSRNIRVDALRGLAIALVIATHILRLRSEFIDVAPWLVRTMLAFNMPLFAFLSGWVLHGREGGDHLRFVGKKALALVVPYLAWVAVELPLRHVRLADLGPRLLAALLNPHAGLQMWFLLVLFWMFVLFTLARGVSHSSWWTALTGVAMGALLVLPLPQTLAIDKIAWLYPFFVFGYLCARYRSKLQGRRALLLMGAGALVAAAGLTVLTGVPRRFDEALMWMAICGFVYALLPARVLSPQAWVGQRSMGIYGGQMVLLPYLIVGAGWGAAIAVPYAPVGAGWIGALLSWALVLAAVTALTWILEHIAPLRWVFLGQWPRAGRKR